MATPAVNSYMKIINTVPVTNKEYVDYTSALALEAEQLLKAWREPGALERRAELIEEFRKVTGGNV